MSEQIWSLTLYINTPFTLKYAMYTFLGSGRFLLDPWSLLWCTLRRPFQPTANAPDSTRQLSLRTMWQRTQIELFLPDLTRALPRLAEFSLISRCLFLHLCEKRHPLGGGKVCDIL